MLAVPKETLPGEEPLDYKPLKQTDIFRLREYYGQNTANTGNKRPWYRLVLDSLFHPFNVLLVLLSITSGFAAEYETMGIMLIMVALSTVLRFHQEWKSQVAVESLLQYVATNVTVVRNDMVLFKDMEYVVPSSDLVPGDFVKLIPGDLIPADVDILTAKDFHVSQAALTGEAIPVMKYSRGRQASWMSVTKIVLGEDEMEPEVKKEKVKKQLCPSPSILWYRLANQMRSIFGMPPNPRTLEKLKDAEQTGGIKGVNFSDLERADVCFMGSAVVSGKATGRVINTGQCTIFGKLAKELVTQKPANNFQLGVRRISWLFFLMMVCMVPPVLILQGVLHDDWFSAFLFAISVAVGLTPEMLPMVVNTTLAKGAMEMSKKKCIVKQLDGIIIMGAVDVLCTDKTGTLTKSEVTLNKHVDGKGSHSPVTLSLGYLNAAYQTCHESPLDAAITQFYHDNQGDTKVKEDYVFVEEIPFDFIRRRLSVVVQEMETATRVLICKGAVEEILGICSSVLIEGQELANVISGDCKVEAMTEELSDNLEAMYAQLCEDGLKLIGVAYKIVTGHHIDKKDERDMTFCGFLAFLDPPKETTQEAIKNLLEHNVTVKVLTGDSPLVCKKICTEIGLKVDQVITGQELADITKDSTSGGLEQMQKICENYSIFAKLTPIQKSDIVKALKTNGHVVGFLGDGINDAPALAEADVGISVDTGMDICKESADIILLEKDLTVIVDAVTTGRKTYGNMIKYIVMGMSTNFGNVFSILVASAWLPFEPMASLHILVQNLLYDTSQMAIPWDTMDPEFLLVPHQWQMKKVVRFMVMIGPWSSLFDICTFLFLWYYFGIQTADNIQDVRLFQSSWFCLGMLTQTLIVYIIRTPKIPFWESWPSKQLLGMTMAMMILGFSLPHIPGFNTWLNLVPLRWEMWPFMGAVCVGYFAVIQMAKWLYMKLFKEWY